MKTQALRILLVEDEVIVACEMAQTLQDHGYEVIGPCVRLKDGEAKAKSAVIDVALLDINLGRGATSEPIAKILRDREIPVVFMTAYDRDQISFIQEEDTLIKKPVFGDMLHDVLRKVLSRRGV